MPYDDLPETDEPLVELETPEEDTRCQLWEDTSPMINLLPESTNGFQLESSETSEKPVLSDLKGILQYLSMYLRLLSTRHDPIWPWRILRSFKKDAKNFKLSKLSKFKYKSKQTSSSNNVY